MKSFIPFNCQFIEKDADLDIISPEIRDLMQCRDKPFVPIKLHIIITPHKETLWKRSILLE